MSNLVQVFIGTFCFVGSFKYILESVNILIKMYSVKKVDKNQLNNIFNNFMGGN